MALNKLKAANILVCIALALSFGPANAAKKIKPKAKPAADAPISVPVSSAATSMIVKRNYAAAFAQLKTEAQAGDAKAAFKLAGMYRLGLGTKRDDEAARHWYEVSANAGNSSAALVLKRSGVAIPATVKAKLDGSSPQNVDAINYASLPARADGQADWLSLAAARGNIEALKAMAPRATANAGVALLAATQAGKVEAISALAVAKPSAVADGRGQTPIMMAVSAVNAELINAVLAAKPELSAKNKLGQTATELAAQTCKTDIFDKLVKAGSSLDGKDGGQPALVVVARACSNWADFKSYFEKSNVNVADAEGRTAAWYGAAHGDSALLGWLAEKGADFSQGDKQGITPLHVAALYKQNRVLQFILSKTSEVDAVAARGATPLMFAGAAGCLDCLKPLIEKKADVSRKDIYGDTAMMYAMRAKELTFAQKLVEFGGNTDARNAAGDTPYRLAIRLGLVKPPAGN